MAYFKALSVGLFLSSFLSFLIIFTNHQARSDLTVLFPPDRPDESKKADKVPSFAFASNWGIVESVTLRGVHRVVIIGHPQWEADGVIRKNRDGKWEVLLNWTTTEATPRHGLGLYTIDAKGELVGAWNWLNEVTEETDGSFKGMTSPDSVHRVKVE